jgi:hypothetical protein
MERHEKVARAHRALSWIYGGLTALFLAFLFMKPGEKAPEAMIGIAIFMGCIFAVHYFTAQAAFARKEGARIASLIIGVLMLAGFPIGTLIGIYLIYNGSSSWDETGKGVLPPRSERQIPTL